ncbi:glycine betaine/L-proline transporter ProP [Bacillus sp. FJAT-49736]|uniref:glycine betaine/L-proline transporter ProP n=1 Tax=Bacillus sp. FJAT-49736 TaxID=2833582 RepID=UPI001BCA2760|nr:glycine betaine/L-proline transporter ProP [Bacillus sp. FJAT-49736]MBS4175593.1 glycine betaine/L-proline transporter ProP [Bacillus sp. FJAT-49736]
MAENVKKWARFKKKSERRLKKEDITIVDADTAKKAVFATALGNAMEWFDFGIYSYLAVTIGKVFFSGVTGPLQLVFSFATFAVAFLVRPFGGMFFGMLGDKLGRKKILTITLVLMSLATLSMGLIPSYARIGNLAPILLLLARLIQGFSAGGEYSGAMTFIVESSPDKKRGFLSSGLEVGTLVGYIAGSGIVTILNYMLGPDKMLDWGWRIPFFIAAPIGLIGLYLRNNLEETPVFEAMNEEKQKENEKGLIKKVFVFHWPQLLKGMVLVLFFNVVDYMLLSYMPSYLNVVLGYGETKGLLFILIVMFIMIPIVLLMGYLSDRIGNKRLILGGLIGIILLSIPSFKMIGNGSNVMVFLGLMILAILLATFEATMPSMLPSLFFTEVRYVALAITFNISVSIFGGTTPLVLSWLIEVTDNKMVPAYYIMAACLIGVITMIFVKETTGKALRGSAPAVEEKNEVAEILENPQEAIWWKEEKINIDEKIAESENE